MRFLRPVAALAVLVALSAGLASCEAPDDVANHVFVSWQNNDSAAAKPYATPSALWTMFSQKYQASDEWAFVHCDGAAGHLHCRWYDKGENTMILAVNNVASPRVVDDVTRVHVASANAGRFFHAWRNHDEASTMSYAADDARTGLFAQTYDPAAGWYLDDCNGAAGHIICNWFDTAGDQVQLISTDASPSMVETAAYFPAP